MKITDSDGFCGFQKIPKERGIIHGSEDVQLMGTGCKTPQFPYMRRSTVSDHGKQQNQVSFKHGFQRVNL